MKKIMSILRKKNWAVVAMNLCAIAAVIENVNAACLCLHHQPKVPEAAKKFRKF